MGVLKFFVVFMAGLIVGGVTWVITLIVNRSSPQKQEVVSIVMPEATDLIPLSATESMIVFLAKDKKEPWFFDSKSGKKIRTMTWKIPLQKP